MLAFRLSMLIDSEVGARPGFIPTQFPKIELDEFIFSGTALTLTLLVLLELYCPTYQTEMKRQRKGEGSKENIEQACNTYLLSE